MATEATFSRYDAADYVTTVEDVAAYLEAAIEEGGMTQLRLFRRSVRSRARETSANSPAERASAARVFTKRYRLRAIPASRRS